MTVMTVEQELRHVLAGKAADGASEAYSSIPWTVEPLAMARLVEAATLLRGSLVINPAILPVERIAYITRAYSSLLRYVIHSGKADFPLLFDDQVISVGRLLEKDAELLSRPINFGLLICSTPSPQFELTADHPYALATLIRAHRSSPAPMPLPDIVWASHGYHLCRLNHPLQIFDDGLALGSLLATTFIHPLQIKTVSYPSSLNNLHAWRTLQNDATQLLSFRKQGRRLASFYLTRGRPSTPSLAMPISHNPDFMAFKDAVETMLALYQKTVRPFSRRGYRLVSSPKLQLADPLPCLYPPVPGQLAFSWEDAAHVEA